MLQTAIGPRDPCGGAISGSVTARGERGPDHVGKQVGFARTENSEKKSVTMSDLEEPPRVLESGVGMKRALARWNQQLQRIHSPILRYSLSVACVALALGLALALQHYQFRDVELPVLCLAIAIVTWHAGIGPSVLAILLSTMSFNYFFIEPIHSFAVSTKDLPYFITFLAWGALVAWFSTVSRRIEAGLRLARDRLQTEVEHRAQREDEIRRLNRELAKRATDLEATNKDLESFAYSVSHDLRAPLRHLVGYSELLQKEASSSLDDKSRRYMQTILQSAKRMGNLIDDLLAFSRVGRAETQNSLVSLEQLVKEVVAELREETNGREIAWKVGALPACYGDRSMLKLVLANLVSNAVKFTRMRARAEIEIGCVDGKNNHEAEMFVRDNGAGFDMQYVDKLFGVFQRLHLAEQFEGNGIGLATVQRIIHRHGGKVRAEGAVDQGATFYFSLPNAQDAVERIRHDHTGTHFGR
ncbi:PAS domain-containing sensor histidine kinase [Bradyrhizobium frederickii]|uniref:histidine kinase n=2 Tax=Bradyrhizobium frederickii TaxID=2560054 RepID=A0A4Y9NWR3_9BRAD|nr:PAS domain-containing sensor histidine kinase [Bradyrhizobium frederickii]